MSKIAKKIAEHLSAKGWAAKLHLFATGSINSIGSYNMAEEIDRALEGKIISKSEVDSLRREVYLQKVAYQSVLAELNGLKVTNLKLNQENVNLKLDNAALKMYPPVYYAMDWGYEKSWTGTTAPLIRERGQNIHKCDICQKLDPPNATHGHSDFEKFVRRLKFWR